MKVFIFTLITIITISSSAFADSYNESEVHSIYERAKRDGSITRSESKQIIHAAQNPHAPAASHAGNKFLEALSWYNDITIGNNDGKFTLQEQRIAFEKQLETYLNSLVQQHSATQRMSAWKMLQKLKILENVIRKSQKTYYAYRAKQLSQISYDNEWNRNNTIKSRKDFYQKVIRGSWRRPVLVKFGLTYCVHCLLMENLGSVPAVAKKYSNQIDVFKLWWNPNDPQNFVELNTIASEEGITSSPIFNLYINGKLVKSEYAFPDEDGSGLEEYLNGFIRP